MNREVLILKKWSVQVKEKPADLFEAAYCDTDPEEIRTLDDTPENRKTALEWLATKRNSCERSQGFASKFWEVEVYGIETCTLDEDGDFVEGGDVLEVAEDE